MGPISLTNKIISPNASPPNVLGQMCIIVKKYWSAQPDNP